MSYLLQSILRDLNMKVKSSTLTSRIPYEAWLARGPPVFLYGGKTGLLRLGTLWPDALL